MGLGLALTGIVAFLVASTPAIYQPIFGTPLKWVVMLAPLASDQGSRDTAQEDLAGPTGGSAQRRGDGLAALRGSPAQVS
jgi:hypothetical protein